MNNQNSNEFMPIERFYPLKAVFEGIWGKGTYSELKHCNNLIVWKKYAERTLKASKQSIQDTIKIADRNWLDNAEGIIELGLSLIKGVKTFDELFGYLSSTYIQLSFHQIGFMPTHSLQSRARLVKGYWKLDNYRTVQYVQTKEQKQSYKRRLDRQLQALNVKLYT